MTAHYINNLKNPLLA